MSSLGPIHRKATIEEYRDLPWQLGYKHEYYGDAIHVSVNHSAVVTLRLTLRRREVDDASVRRPRALDAQDLIRLYRLSLNNVPEYIEWRGRDFRRRSREAVRRYLTRRQQPWRPAARIAHDGRHAVAAAFIADTRVGPILQPIFIRPSHQRRGLGTLLLRHVENQLLDMGATHLHSNCHLANGPSLDWHRRCGFEELPDIWLAAHRFRYCAYELKRRERLGQINEADAAELERQKAHWESEWERLTKIEEGDFKAAHPSMRF